MSQIDMPFIAINNKGLEVKNITKSYSKKKILDNVSLNLNRGESVALLGPNGAGKTSLFYIVMGLIKSDSGSIIINNDNISTWKWSISHGDNNLLDEVSLLDSDYNFESMYRFLKIQL